jgi:hypothetical protein
MPALLDDKMSRGSDWRDPDQIPAKAEVPKLIKIMTVPAQALDGAPRYLEKLSCQETEYITSSPKAKGQEVLQDLPDSHASSAKRQD